MATANTIVKKLAAYLKPAVNQAVGGLNKHGLDQVEFTLDAIYAVLNSEPEKDGDGNVHDEALDQLRVLLNSMPVEDTVAYGYEVSKLGEQLFGEEGKVSSRWQTAVVPAFWNRFGPAYTRLVNSKIIEGVRKSRIYAHSPSVVDEIINRTLDSVEPWRFYYTMTREVTAYAEEVKIEDPFQHENVDGKDTPPASSEDEGGSLPPPDELGGGGSKPDPDNEDERMFNAEAFKAQCGEATADQIKAGLGDKASDEIKAGKWTCSTEKQVAQYNNGAKRHFLPRFNEGSTYVTAGVGALLGVGGTLVAQSLMAGGGEVEDDVSNVTPMRKTGTRG